MAKFSQKVGGKEVGQASVYASRGTKITPPKPSDAEEIAKLNVSIGNLDRGIYKENTGKVKTRGTGAATKGLYSSTKLG